MGHHWHREPVPLGRRGGVRRRCAFAPLRVRACVACVCGPARVVCALNVARAAASQVVGREFDMALVRPTSPALVIPGCSPDAKAALLAIYGATRGPEWSTAKGWSVPASDPCLDTWSGVTCKGGVVFAL